MSYYTFHFYGGEMFVGLVISFFVFVLACFIVKANYFADKPWRLPVAIIVSVVSALTLVAGIFIHATDKSERDITKPVIYLYPQSDQVVDVDVDISNGYLACTVPEATENGSWHVMAHPDGSIDDLVSGGRDYGYLFWEAKAQADWDESKGFCISRSQVAEFLADVLPQMGLSDRECHDFESYWIPRLISDDHDWFLISFQDEAYENIASLSVKPTPDSIIRVFMVARGLDNPIDVDAPVINDSVRSGFTVVEWGGTIV